MKQHDYTTFEDGNGEEFIEDVDDTGNTIKELTDWVNDEENQLTSFLDKVATTLNHLHNRVLTLENKIKELDYRPMR